MSGLLVQKNPKYKKSMKVLKFGGSSVASPETINKVKTIVTESLDNRIVVVSAFSGITDHLQQTAKMAAQGQDDYRQMFSEIEQRHLETTAQLITDGEQRSKAWKVIRKELDDLAKMYQGIHVVRELTPRILDYVLSFGERLSAYIISQAIDKAVYADARQFIRTDSAYGKAKLDFEISNQLINEYFKTIDQIAVIPGFIASSPDGETTTLGRGGSDYTAAIMAAALSADLLEIWTDVNGFMTADPGKVEKAYTIKQLSYAEAMELSHFGAKVIYTPSILPVQQKGIRTLIKNTFYPEFEGTLITHFDKALQNRYPIKGISSIDDVALVTIQGSGMIGVSGTAMRLFGSLAKEDINIILISQASSEHTISFAIAPQEVEHARQVLFEEFDLELNHKRNLSIDIETDLSIIAIVGENMKSTPGIAAKLFDSMGRNGINIVAIAQGSSELNISTVVKEKSLRKALNVIHDSFFLSEYLEVHLFQIGVGTVGGMLLEQLNQQQQQLLKDHKLKINLVGVADTNAMYFDTDGIELKNYQTIMQEKGMPSDLNKFVEQMDALNLRNSIFIDCTASADVAALYPKVLDTYTSIVTANKIANSSEYKKYQFLKESSTQKGLKFLYETNVGAGLPVIRTISDLIKSGDKIVKIEAVLSGTLNYIFNVLSPEIPLSKAIHMAQEKGYSEPDPRIDLSGIDVLRKLLILSREAGYQIEKEDIKTIPFLPKSCQKTASLDEFWKEVPKADADFEKKRQELTTAKKRWRYVASMENGEASIELIGVDRNHPFYHLEGSDNIILLYTERYVEQPLIVKGAGAGAAVTASGVFADIIRVANI